MKTYSVYLDEEVVKEAMRNVERQGGKLSPMINEFLKRENKKNRLKDNGDEDGRE